MFPALTWLLLMAISMTIALIKNGEPRPAYSLGSTIFAFVIEAAILWWGGFFAPLFK